MIKQQQQQKKKKKNVYFLKLHGMSPFFFKSVIEACPKPDCESDMFIRGPSPLSYAI